MKLIFFLFFALFFLRGYYVLDPDFGWHIRMGQIMLREGIPATDQLSYTMSHYPVVNHEWLTDIVIAILYPHVNKIGLAIFFAGLASASLLLSIVSLSKPMMRYVPLPLFLTVSTLMSFTGVRPQVISWFFLAVLLQLLSNKRFDKTRLFLIPILFAFWANLHGAFALGIVLLGIITIASWFDKKSFSFPWILVLSILATFLNPYLARIWWEVWKQITDQNMRMVISEWTPSFDLPNLSFWAFFALSLLLTARFWRKYSLSELAIYIFLLIAGLTSKRHIPLWVIAALPITEKSVFWLSQEARGIKYGAKRYLLAYKGFFIVCIILFIINAYIMYYATLSARESVFYPVKATNFIRTHRFSGNLWSPYDWNGYLVWKVPGLRVFIYGMMPSWRNHQWGRESHYAFDEYNNLLAGKLLLEDVLDRYAIDRVLVPSESMDKAFFKDRIFRFTALNRQIKQLHMKEIYRDERVIIYTR